MYDRTSHYRTFYTIILPSRTILYDNFADSLESKKINGFIIYYEQINIRKKLVFMIQPAVRVTNEGIMMIQAFKTGL